MWLIMFLGKWCLILNSVHMVESSDGGTSHLLNICSRDKNNELFFYAAEEL